MNNKRKVLIFIPEFSKLTETFILREVEQLIKNDVLDIMVFSLKKGSVTLPDIVLKKTTYNRINIFNLISSIKFYILNPIKMFRIFKEISNNGNRNILSSFYLFIKSVAYADIIQKYNPNMIYSHFMSESSTISLIVSKLLNVPLAISAHAKDVLQTNGPVSENVELINLKSEYSDFITVCNRNAYNKIINSIDNKYKSKINLDYHGIDHKKLENIIDNTNILDVNKNGKLILLTIGRFVEKKGFKYLIEATKKLKQNNIDFKLYIAGANGDLYSNINDLIFEYNLQNDIEILNQGKGVSFETIVSYFNIADIFILPSINTNNSDADGIPNVLIESSIFKVPIITTDAGSITEFLTNNSEALIVEQKNSQDLYEAIIKLSNNDKLKNKLIKNAYDKAIKMFDINNNIKKIQDLILCCFK